MVNMIGGKFKTQLRSFTKISETFSEHDLEKPEMIEWVKTAIDSSEVLESIRSEAPTDGNEVVEWMHFAAADMAIVSALSADYNRVGGRIRYASGDGYIPGVRCGRLRVQSVRGSAVRNRGYAIVYTPRGSFRVPVGGKTTYANRDILAWSTLPAAYRIQFVITLIQYTKLPKAPINRRVRFASCHGRTAPIFVTCQTRVPSPIMVLKFGISSNKSQKLMIRGRGDSGSYEKVYFEDSLNVEQGQSEYEFVVSSFPMVPKMTIEFQPEDRTKTILDYIEVYP